MLRIWVVLTTAALALGGLAGASAPSAGAGRHRFVQLQLPSTPPAPPGVVCPGSTACWNHAVEPQIRADETGAFYLSSENGLFAGTIAAKSVDGGLHYASLPSPNSVSAGEDTGFAPGGGDTDLATAPVRNAAGFDNVYVASLSLLDVDVSTSTDGGASWKLNPTAAQLGGDDREWIAADGASKVCISYHDLETFNVDVDCSYDAGATFTQHALPGAIDAAHAFLLENNQIGNLAIDPASHVVYQVIAGIADPTEAACGLAFTCKYHAVWMAVSTDGGRTFTDYPVFVGPSPLVGYAHQFPSVAVDRAGNVYALFSDDRAVYYSYSTDRGRTWSPPVAISRGEATTAIFPWAAAGDAGKLDVVYYGTTYHDDGTPPDAYPPSAEWYVYFAQSLDALSPHTHFSQVQASPVVHTGSVCEGGISCSGNRDLYDDFGVAASPTTGLASIAYTTDQYAADTPPPGCTPDRTNTIRCDRTAVATQTDGAGIFGTTTK
jgi:BNR/Asp-box repeat